MNNSSKAKLFIFSAIFCWEMLLIIIFFISIFLANKYKIDISRYYNLLPEQWKLLVSIPGLALALSMKDTKHVLLPDHPNKDLLLRWPNYWALKMACFSSIAYQLIFCLLALYAWISSSSFISFNGLIALIISIIGGITSYIPIHTGRVKVQELLAQKEV